jgi:UPF0716 family protein affecting phage T7 exclusion
MAEVCAPRRIISVPGQQISLPQSRTWRILLGVALIVAGFLGFLPVPGFWMGPLGVVVLSLDVPIVRRLCLKIHLKIQNWWQRRSKGGSRQG